MKMHCNAIVITCLLLAGSTGWAQKVTITGEAVVGVPGQGNNVLTLNTERSWIFRQLNTGPSTDLELYSTVGLKNFIISTTGNVGIGLLAPLAKLHVNGSIIAGPRITFGSAEYLEDGGSFIISCNGALVSTGDGVDDLGAASNRWRTIYATTGVVNTSDMTAKSNIQNIPYGLKDIMLLHPVSFSWRELPEYGTKLGLLAQEVQQVMSEVVVDYDWIRDEESGATHKVPNAQLGIYYSDLIPVIIKAMQEQQLLITEKDAKIAGLENKLNHLAERLSTIEKSLSSSRQN